jgi:hypothetical protein
MNLSEIIVYYTLIFNEIELRYLMESWPVSLQMLRCSTFDSTFHSEQV